MISKVSITMFLILIIVVFHYVTADKGLFRISIDRVPSHLSKKTNCTVSKTNVTICERISRTFGKTSVIKSSAYESLINEADNYFMGMISIGTPSQNFLTQFDTGSPDLWVASSKCMSDCADFNKYISSKSTTYVADGRTFSITYDDNDTATGFLSIDTVTFNGISVKNQIFAECTSLKDLSDVAFDGIMGLSHSSLTRNGDKTFFYNMWSQGLISEPIFSFYLNPDLNARSGGELIFGGIDSTKYTGSITYLPVVVEEDWEFQMDSVKVGSTVISSSAYAIADTGTTFIAGPTSQVKALNDALGGTYDSSSGMYTVGCLTRSLSSFPNVTFTIGGTAFTLTPLQYLLIYEDDSNKYVCYSVFYSQDEKDSNGNDIWTLGDYFLYRYYSTFDIVNNQTGFATSISYNSIQSFDSTLFPESAATATITKSTASKVETGSASVYKLPFYFYLFILLVMMFTHTICFF